MEQFIEALSQRFHLYRLDSIPFLKICTEKTGLRPSRIAIVLCALFTFHLLSLHGLKWLTTGIGFLYPAYITAKVIRHWSDETEEEGKFWLKYWMVYGLVYLTEVLFLPVLRIIPYYYVLKVVFLVWLFHPDTQGACLIYTKTVKAFLETYEPKIEERLAPIQRFDSQEFLKNTFKSLTANAVKAVIRA